MTNREFELLKILIRNKNLELSRNKLLDLAWGMDYFGDERTVDVHIQRLRKRLNWKIISKPYSNLAIDWRLERAALEKILFIDIYGISTGIKYMHVLAGINGFKAFV